MSSVHMDAKINSFVTRKLATMGENVLNTPRDASQTSGIYYEAVKLPRIQAKRQK